MLARRGRQPIQNALNGSLLVSVLSIFLAGLLPGLTPF
jgi:hypothetical protein